MFVVNLGGEGEVPGSLNQQGPWALRATWTTVGRKSLAELVNDGHAVLICPNDAIALPDNSVDVVYTNNVPVDRPAYHGVGVQSSEIRRILKPGGVWYLDGEVEWIKPLPPS
jgi:hypothetical protein